MSEITITLKADGAPWVVIHGDTPEEAEALLDAAGSLSAKVIEAATAFKSAGGHLAPPRGNAGGGNRYAGKPASAYQGGSQGSGGGSPSAAAGELTHILYIPFDQADKRQEVKDQGARWDGERKGWKVTAEVAAKYPQFAR